MDLEQEVCLLSEILSQLLNEIGTLVMGSIITSDLVPIEIRGTYQSYINIIYGVGSALGAATGGAIADTLGWRWEFGFQVPFLSCCLLLGILTVPRNLGLKEGVENDSLAQAMKKFDYKGSLLLTMSITTLILGLVSLSQTCPGSFANCL